MNPQRPQDQKWFPYAVGGCITVICYVLLIRFDVVWAALGTFVGYFKAVILGGVLAYLINPLAKWLQGRLFGKGGGSRKSWTLSVALAVILGVLLLLLLLSMVIPQLVQSVAAFAANFEDYVASLRSLLDGAGFQLPNQEEIDLLIGNVTERVSAFAQENASRMMSMAADAGKGIFAWVIALILSVYLLMSKDSVKNGALRLARALFRPRTADALVEYLRRCDDILVHFVTDSLMESVVVGGLNAVFMVLTRMPYVGLVSVVVGVTNLIPTFGPIMGGVIGAFVLLLVNPIQAVIFVAFTFALQFVDGYVIKPKLFGDSLGVSGLLILVAGIVGGNMFGFLGVLLAIPAAAILSFTCKDYLLPALERRQK